MKRLILAVLIVALSAGITADEGMWTFDNVPRADIAKRYGVQLTDQWLAHLQKSVVRLETGCTGSFVSAEGLVLTNHHCVAECLANNSSAQRDLMANGYVAARREDELVCQGAQASVLMSTENVTDRVTKAIAGVAPSGGHRRPQQGADDARSGLRAGVEESRDAAGLRIRHLVSGGTVLALQVQALRRGASRVRAGAGRSPLSAATRTISSSRAGVSTCRCCACTRTANRHRRRTI